MSATCTCCHDRSSRGICEINNAFICWCKEITKVLRKTQWFFMWPFPRSSWFLMKHNFLIHKIEKQVFSFQSSTKKHEFWLSCEFVMVKSLTKLWNFQLSLSFFSMIFFYDIWFFFCFWLSKFEMYNLCLHNCSITRIYFLCIIYITIVFSVYKHTFSGQSRYQLQSS